MPALKEPKRISLAEGLALLEGHLPIEQAKRRLRQAFIQKAFSQEPLFALPYDEADIDWTTGLVKIPRKQDRFCPTLSRADFNSYFFQDQADTEVGLPDDDISEDGRQARFARWEKIGVDLIKADLINGGHRLVGGPPAVRELAQKWVRIKEAEAKAVADTASAGKRADIVTLKPTIWGMSIDLKEAWRRFQAWRSGFMRRRRRS
ncbi:hypothetical protein SAMN05444161_3570 [Rhizobiales bacterium GAS191]|nr:hypothetical protein SAMN05444161_3570 [Rhizobiales bacterium GAS191]